MLADDFPGRATDPVGRFLQHRGHGLEDVAHHRSDERHDHQRQDQPGGEDADAERRAREQRDAGGGQPRLDVGLDQRREDEQAPDAVDDRRHAGEQFDRGAERAAQPQRAGLGEEHRDAETDRHGDQQRDRRGDDGAVDRDHRAVDVVRRTPGGAGQESRDRILPERRPGLDRSERDQHAGKADQHQRGEREGDRGEQLVLRRELAAPALRSAVRSRWRSIGPKPTPTGPADRRWRCGSLTRPSGSRGRSSSGAEAGPARGRPGEPARGVMRANYFAAITVLPALSLMSFQVASINGIVAAGIGT